MKTLSGLLLLDKEKGYTSQDAVSVLRGILRERRIGHTGTLDPSATGVLPILIGPATKLSRFLLSEDKVYDSRIRFGLETDTEDMDGNVTKTCPLPSEEAVREAVLSLQGEILQVPPMVSALKKDGVRLYELARQGMEVEREARKVTIYSSEILGWEEPCLHLLVHCSKGTYIRSLARDIGRRAGSGAVIEELDRIRSGSLEKKNCLRIRDLQEKKDRGENFSDCILPPTEIFPDTPILRVSEDAEVRFRNGNPLKKKECAGVLREGQEGNKDGMVFLTDGEETHLYKDEGYRYMPLAILK